MRAGPAAAVSHGWNVDAAINESHSPDKAVRAIPYIAVETRLRFNNSYHVYIQHRRGDWYDEPLTP